MKPVADELMREFALPKHDTTFTRLATDRRNMNGPETVAAYRKQLKDYAWNYFSV
jgi:hypothetical protein